MGLLDNVMGQAKSALAGQESSLGPMLLSMLGGGGEGQAAQTNGLSNLIGKFKQAGLGNIVESWMSDQQPNQSVTPDQVNGALGEQTTSAMAGKTGMPKGALLATLAAILPKLVSSMTQNGQKPAQTAGEAEAPASTQGTAAAAGAGTTDPTEPTQSATQQG